MRKIKRGIRGDREYDIELADVNEQELAKAVAEEKINEESPICGEKSEELVEKSDESGTGFIIIEPTGGEMVAGGEERGELVSAPKEREAEDGEDGERLGEAAAPPRGGDVGDDGDDGEESLENGRMGRIYAATLAVCLLLAIAALGLAAYSAKGGDEEAEVLEESEAQTEEVYPPSSNENSDAEALADLSVSAVSVVAEKENGEIFYASGTAVLEDGYVATVYGAVKGATGIKIVLGDGRAYPADVIAYNESVGLALLSTDADGLRVVKAGEAELCVGEGIFAVGNVGGELSASFFEGRVSHPSRSFELDTDGGVRIASTVEISGFDNASMQGAPIFNQSGEAIAFVFAALEGKNTVLALPIDGVLGVLGVMKDGGEPSREALEALAYSPASLSVWGKQSCAGGVWGVEITSFEGGGDDSAVKLRRGDLIYRINDTFVAGTDALRASLSELRAGDEARIYVLRGGQRLSFDVILG